MVNPVSHLNENSITLPPVNIQIANTQQLFQIIENYELGTPIDESEIRRLIQEGVEYIIINDQGYSLLQFAAIKGFVFALEEMINNGADVNIIDSNGENVFFLAARHGQIQCLKAIINSGFDPNIPDHRGWVPLHYFVRLIEFNIDTAFIAIHALSTAGVDMNSKDNTGFTALHIMILLENLSLVRNFLLAGADITVNDNSGRSCVEIACWTDNQEIINSVKYYSPSNIENTPLMKESDLRIAARCGNIEKLQELINEGVNIFSRNRNNETALHLSIKSGQMGAMKKLLQAGANRVVAKQYFYIREAIQVNSIEAVNLLLLDGINFDVLNKTNDAFRTTSNMPRYQEFNQSRKEIVELVKNWVKTENALGEKTLKGYVAKYIIQNRMRYEKERLPDELNEFIKDIEKLL